MTRLKRKLAKLIEQAYKREGDFVICDPKSLNRNYASYLYDACSWGGKVIGAKNNCIASWVSMTELIREKELNIIHSTGYDEIC